MTDYFRETSFTCLRRGILAAGIMGLAACGTTPVEVEVTEPEPAIEEAEVSAPAPEPMPPYVEGKGYALIWTMKQNGAISVPKEIAAKAKKTCMRVGHEKSYAYVIEFNGDEVIGYFRCSGDGN